MSRDTATDLDKLARGEAVERDAFLALLGDPAAREGLERLARARAALDDAGVPDAPPGVEMDVSWEELALHAEGALTDEERRLAVDRFLNRHFPEALAADGSGNTTMTSPGTGDTVVVSPRRKGDGGKDTASPRSRA